MSFASLSGSGAGGDLNVSGAPVSNPFGLALDRPGGRVYWANGSNTIGSARLDGSGGSPLDITGATINGPRGVAIDPTTNRLYWLNFTGDTISFASLAGGQGGLLPPNGTATRNGLVGPAIDPAAGEDLLVELQCRRWNCLREPERRRQRQPEHHGLRALLPAAGRRPEVTQSNGGAGDHRRLDPGIRALVLNRQLGGRPPRLLPLPGAAELRLSMDPRRRRHRRGDLEHADGRPGR